MDSVITQSLKDIEIICIDSGSTDGSFTILKEYAAKDNRIKIIFKGTIWEVMVLKIIQKKNY